MHADSVFAGWLVGNQASVYTTVEASSNLLDCTFEDNDEQGLVHRDHVVVESFGGALVRAERCSFSIAGGVRPCSSTCSRVRIVPWELVLGLCTESVGLWHTVPANTTSQRKP